MKVAVSGANGFIGRHVVMELERLDISPTLWARPSSVLPQRWASHHIVRTDMLEPPARVYDLLGCPDVLIHLGWGGLPNYQSLHHFEHELPAQYRLLKQLVQAGLPSLMVTGTCFEYGLQSGQLTEEMDTRPSNPYGLAKDVLRRQLQFLQRELPYALTWARVFYVHGEGQAANSLLPQLCRAAASGEAMFPMSGGEQLRDYLSVTELARKLVALVATRRENGVVNVCSGQPISVRRLVESWIEARGLTIRPELGRYPYPSHEPFSFWGDDTKLRRCLSIDQAGGQDNLPRYIKSTSPSTPIGAT
jgi:dTDP-6-deoxy-L-talose 4-dehydrogenase (NAD+)